MYIYKYIHVQIHIDLILSHIHIYTYIHIHICTSSFQTAEIVIFEKLFAIFWVSQEATVCSCFLSFSIRIFLLWNQVKNHI